MGVESNKGTKGNAGKTIVPFGGDLGGGKYSSPAAAKPTIESYKNEATYFNDTNNKAFDHIRIMHQHAQALHEYAGGASVFAELAKSHLETAAQAHEDSKARGDYDYSGVEPHVTAAAEMMHAAHGELSALGMLTIGHERMMDKFHEAHSDYKRTISPASVTRSDSGGFRVNLDSDYRARTGDPKYLATKKKESGRSQASIDRKKQRRQELAAERKAAKLKGEI
jgi:hypothetical protein